jgi:antitoxin component YwqK of YwqJK toxin-antitoxin module
MGLILSQNMKNIIISIGITICTVATTTAALAQTQTPPPKNTKDKIKDKKAQADSTLQKLGFTNNMGVSANVGGKTVKGSDAVDFMTETLPDLGLKIKAARKREKQRRQKKKTLHTAYEGEAIERIVTATNKTQEEFHVLKNDAEPTAYVTDIYWYDTDNRRTSKSVIKDKDIAMLLHGPYKRYVDGNLVEEGYYYKGTKDGRWESYDANYTLLDKTNWWHGFPAESRISYYDSAHTKVREVVPMHYGKRKGEYLMFYAAGQLMAKGQYDNDVPVGTWNEYFQFKRQRKKETRYPRYWYEDSEPVVLNEWDDKGKLIYQAPKEKTTEEN